MSGEASAVSPVASWFDNLPLPAFEIDSGRNVRALNKHARELCGAEEASGRLRDEILSQCDSWKAGLRPAWAADVAYAVRISVEGRATYHIPQYIASASGDTVLLEDAAGLRGADQARHRALSLLGHEVKTPVTSMRVALHLLLEERLGALTPDQRELIEASRDDCENMISLLQQILELSRIETGRESGTRLWVEASRLLANPLANLKRTFESGAQTVTVAFPADEMPALFVDVAGIERTISGFLKTAARVGKPGSAVAVAVSASRSWIRFSVSCTPDSGHQFRGKETFFDPFAAPGDAKSADLGLAICKAIVARHDGRVGAETDGGGLTLFFELPRVAGDATSHCAAST